MSKQDKKVDNVDNKDFIIPNDIDIDELIETTNLNILPDYAKEIIPKDDFQTTRKVVIETLPKIKNIDTEKFTGKRRFMTISDNGILYSVAIDSISFYRSFIALDIKINKVKEKKDIDLSRLIGKTVGIKRIQFTNKDGLTNQCLNFFPLI